MAVSTSSHRSPSDDSEPGRRSGTESGPTWDWKKAYGLGLNSIVPHMEWWTSSYHLFWCSLVVRGFDPYPDRVSPTLEINVPNRFVDSGFAGDWWISEMVHKVINYNYHMDLHCRWRGYLTKETCTLEVRNDEFNHSLWFATKFGWCTDSRISHYVLTFLACQLISAVYHHLSWTSLSRVIDSRISRDRIVY